MVTDEMRKAAEAMLAELYEHRLHVVLLPSLPHHQPTERLRRVAVTQNPCWYQRLCSRYTRNRRNQRKKKDTYIVRSCVERALIEIATGYSSTPYAHRLLPFVKEQAELGKHYQPSE